jgi:hypothetical protein
MPDVGWSGNLTPHQSSAQTLRVIEYQQTTRNNGRATRHTCWASSQMQAALRGSQMSGVRDDQQAVLCAGANRSPANTQPAAHMSTAELYSVLPNSSSGARYHRANTCTCTRSGLRGTVWRQPPGTRCRVHRPSNGYQGRKQCYTSCTDGQLIDCHPAALTWLVYFRSGLPKMRDRPKSASFRLPAQRAHRSLSMRWIHLTCGSCILSNNSLGD